jgi:hypothetical protein
MFGGFTPSSSKKQTICIIYYFDVFLNYSSMAFVARAVEGPITSATMSEFPFAVIPFFIFAPFLVSIILKFVAGEHTNKYF